MLQVIRVYWLPSGEGFVTLVYLCIIWQFSFNCCRFLVSLYDYTFLYFVLFHLFPETTVAGAMYVHHAAFYNITDCNINSAEDVINKIQLTIKSVVQQLTCYSSNICSYTESEVFYCGKLRQKREIKQTIFGFNVTLMCNPDKRKY